MQEMLAVHVQFLGRRFVHEAPLCNRNDQTLATSDAADINFPTGTFASAQSVNGLQKPAPETPRILSICVTSNAIHTGIRHAER
jgi:hypothetical protein